MTEQGLIEAASSIIACKQSLKTPTIGIILSVLHDNKLNKNIHALIHTKRNCALFT